MTLPKHHRSGRTPEPLLRRRRGQPEAGDHLVEEQQRAGPVARRPQPGEEPRLGRRRGPCWPATGSTTTTATASSSAGTTLYGATTVSATAAGGHAGRAGQALVGHAAAARGQQRVGVAVVAAGELDDLRPSGGAPGQADGATWPPRCPTTPAAPARRRPPGAAASSASRTSPAVGRAVGGAVGGGRTDGLDDRRVGVAQDRGAVGLHVVDVAAALDVPDVRRPRPGRRSRACRRPTGRPGPAS